MITITADPNKYEWDGEICEVQQFECTRHLDEHQHKWGYIKNAAGAKAIVSSEGRIPKPEDCSDFADV